MASDIPPTPQPFNEETGQQTDLTADSRPLDFFQLFVDDTVLKMLVEGTNSYAAKTIAQKEPLSKSSRWRKWKDVTMEEIKAVIAIVINMGTLQCPEVEAYWMTSWESYIPFFHDVHCKKLSGNSTPYLVCHHCPS